MRAPEVTINIPRLGYGILEVGKEERIEFSIDNPNPIPAMWTLDVAHPDFTLDLKSGILEPLESAVVAVTWAPKSEYNLRGTVLNVGGAKYSEYAISGVSVRPKVDFDLTQVDLGELFVGVETQFQLDLRNYSPITAQYQIIPTNLLPSVPPGVLIEFEKPSGQIAPFQTEKLNVKINGEQSGVFKDFILACEIFNAKRPTFVQINGEVKGVNIKVWSDSKVIKLSVLPDSHSKLWWLAGYGTSIWLSRLKMYKNDVCFM